jgi:hypothetical protein
VRDIAGFVGPLGVRLAIAVLHVGAKIPELLAALDPGSSAAKPASAAAGTPEARVEKALASLTWLPAPRRRYRYSFDAASGGTRLPAFMQVQPANPWAQVVVRLSERLGLDSWGWKLSRLRGQIADLVPRLAHRAELGRTSSKVAKWLKELTPSERAAWQELASVARDLDDQTAQDALAAMVCRLGVMVLPHHLLALVSLQSMRAPVAVLWDLERFILSDVWSAARKASKIKSLVPVPNSLQRLSTVLADGAVPVATTVKPKIHRPS